MNTLLVFIFILIIANTLFEAFLTLCNMRHISKHIGAGDRFADFMDGENYAKSISYSLAKNQFSLLSIFYNSLITIAIVFTDVIKNFYITFSDVFGYGIFGQAAVLFSAFYAYYLLHLPINFINQFSLEQKYGFNKSSVSMWIVDNAKGFIVAAIVAIPILASLVKIIECFSKTWWIIGAIFWLILQLFFIWFYPKFIIPVFNKLSPLEDGELKKKLNDLAKRCGFNSASVKVIDSSKRSSHSNAYCSSFGKIQQIVLFDTLVKNMSTEEVEAVLAHEIGHHKKNHVAKSILASFVIVTIGLKVFQYLSYNELFLTAFKIENLPRTVPVIMVFAFVFPMLTYWLNPLLNAMSRKYEYEADKFAKDTATGSHRALISALRSLYAHNLGNLFPHPLYSFFHYSHPTLLEREKSLNQID